MPPPDASTSTSSSTAPPERVGFSSWWALAVLVTFSIVSWVDRTIIVLLVDPIKADLGLSDFEMGLVMGPAFGVFYAIVGLAAGWAADRLPRRSVLYAGVTWWSFATMACGLVTTFASLFAARMAVAVGEATFSPSAYSIVADKFPKSRLTTALAILSGGPKLGQTFAYVVGGALIALTTTWGVVNLPVVGDVKPWQMVFLLVGAPGALIAFLAYSFSVPKPAAKVADGVPTASLIGFLREHRKVLAPMFTGFALVATASGAMNSWVATFMIRHHEWTPAQLGPVLGAVTAIAAFVLVPKGLLVDWLYSKGYRDAPLRFYTWLLIAVTPIAPLSYFFPSPYAFLIVYGLSNGVALPVLLYATSALQMMAPSELRGRLIGVLMFLLPLFMLGLGPPLVGAMTDFVFKDPNSIGTATALIIGVAMTTALVLLRWTLRLMKPYHAAAPAAS